jgi:peptide/nickel transport system permease protein
LASTINAAKPTRTGARLGVLFWISVGWLVIVGLVAVFGWLLPLPDPTRISPADKFLPVWSEGHLLGTDQLGRDMLARLVDGAKVSVFISLTTVTVGIAVGGLIGTTVGYFGGRIEAATMAMVNIALSFPSLVILLGVIAMAGQSLKILTIVFSILAIPGYTRFARASTLTIKQNDWVTVSAMVGTPTRRIVFRVLMPEVLLTLVTFGLLAVGGVIVAEGVIAFLGFGVPPPQATWGGMIADGNRAFADDVLHVALVPATTMFMTILALNLVGDGLRRRFQVRDAQI